jgi:pyrimidine operon attenuation protein/uracil phosphoribosyltransferase
MNSEIHSVDALIQKLADDLKTYLVEHELENPVITGIHSGGIWVAERLHQILAINEPLGHLNIAFYRDDFSRIGMHPRVTPSNLPFDVDDRNIILVDDVLFTGRTIRAGMNEIFDFGRPASITLAVLVERSGRELPIQADVSGKSIALNPGEHVKLSGPEPLVLEVRSAG